MELELLLPSHFATLHKKKKKKTVLSTWHFGCWGEDAAAPSNERACRGDRATKVWRGWWLRLKQHILGRTVATVSCASCLLPLGLSLSHHTFPPGQAALQSKHHSVGKSKEGKWKSFCSGSPPHTWKTKWKTKCIDNNKFSASNCWQLHKQMCQYKKSVLQIRLLKFQANEILVNSKGFGKDLGNHWYRSFHFLEYTYCCKKLYCWRC